MVNINLSHTYMWQPGFVLYTEHFRKAEFVWLIHVKEVKWESLNKHIFSYFSRWPVGLGSRELHTNGKENILFCDSTGKIWNYGNTVMLKSVNIVSVVFNACFVAFHCCYKYIYNVACLTGNGHSTEVWKTTNVSFFLKLYIMLVRDGFCST